LPLLQYFAFSHRFGRPEVWLYQSQKPKAGTSVESDEKSGSEDEASAVDL
jgi:hypothetical protein